MYLGEAFARRIMYRHVRCNALLDVAVSSDASRWRSLPRFLGCIHIDLFTSCVSEAELPTGKYCLLRAALNSVQLLGQGPKLVAHTPHHACSALGWLSFEHICLKNYMTQSHLRQGRADATVGALGVSEARPSSLFPLGGGGGASASALGVRSRLHQTLTLFPLLKAATAFPWFDFLKRR